MDLGTVLVHFAAETSGFASGLQSMISQVAGFAPAAIAGFAAVGVAILGIGIAGVSAAAGFQQTMLQVQALAGVSASDAQMATQAILGMAGAIGQTPQQLAQGLYYIASAGYSAKDSLTLLDLSARAAAVGNTQTEVTANALTATLNAYGLSASSAKMIMDQMVASVSMGKTEFADYAKVIGIVSVNAKQSGVSFAEATSAFSALTNVMASSKQAKDALDALLQTSSRFDVLNSRAKAMGLAFDEDAYKTMNFEERLKYLQQITGGDTQELTKLLGRQNAVAAITALSANNFDMYNKALKAVTGSTGDLDAAFAKTSSGFNASMGRLGATFQVLLILIGNNLLPILTSVANALTPLVTAFAKWISSGQAAADVTRLWNQLMGALQPIIAYLGPKVEGLATAAQNLATQVAPLVARFIEWAAPAMILHNVLTGLTVVVGLLIDGFTGLLNGIGGIITFFTTAGSNAQGLWHILMFLWDLLQRIGSFLLSTFTPVWQQLVTTVQSQLIPAWNSLVKAITPLLPTLQLVGEVLLGVVAVAFGLVISMLGGVIGAIAGFATGIIQAIGGIVQFVSGVIQILAGLIAFFVDLFTGNFTKLGADLQAIWSGILLALQGFWNFFQGIWNAGQNAIIGFVTGFVSTIVGWFQALYNLIVGHSIIPDLVTGILGWFQSLWTQSVGLISGMVMAVVSWVQSLATDVDTWVQTMVSNVVASVQGMVGNVVSWFTDMYNQVVGHSIVKTMADEVGVAFQTMSSNASAITSTMASSVTSSLSSMADSGLAEVGRLSSGAITLLQQLGSEGATIMQNLDAEAIASWNQVQSVIAQANAAWALANAPPRLAGLMQKNAMAGGGIINELILGVGQSSGMAYSFGEAGPEAVVPLGGRSSPGGVGATGTPRGAATSRPLVLELHINGQAFARATVDDIGAALHDRIILTMGNIA